MSSPSRWIVGSERKRSVSFDPGSSGGGKGAAEDHTSPRSSGSGKSHRFSGFGPINEKDIWRRLREAGLDEETLKKKDKAALIAHITKLETELYEYQYNMGVILLERKEYEVKCEQMKVSAFEVEEKLRQELIAHSSTRAEAIKQEEALKKALGIEKQCVADLEKALHEIRSASAEAKYTSEDKLSKAHEMLATANEKILTADAKYHAAEALSAEANRKKADAERILSEVNACEDACKRQQQAFIAEREAHESNFLRQQENLQNWERKLSERQERSIEEQKILNHKEELIIEKLDTLKQMKSELHESKQYIEKQHSELKKEESDLKARFASLMIREEAISKSKLDIEKKEQDLLLLQEKLKVREQDTLQKLTEEHKISLEDVRREFEADLDQKRKLVEEELENKKIAAESREAEIKFMEEKLNTKEQQIEKKVEKLKEKESDIDSKLRRLREREKNLKMEVKELDSRKNKLDAQEKEIRDSKQQLQKLKAALEEEKSHILKEQMQLEAAEAERNELMALQVKLKEEIDILRAQQQELLKETDALNQEKQTFEKEWEILDEKKEQLRQELEEVEAERKRIKKWFKEGEEKLKQEKAVFLEEHARDIASLQLEKEAFERYRQHQEVELFAKVKREQDNLVRDIELRRSEMEVSLEKRREELEKEFQEKEFEFQKKKDKELLYLSTQKELFEKELEEISSEKRHLERKRKDIATNIESTERGWSDMKRDIEELQIQSEKLKELRESLHKERTEYQAQQEEPRRIREDVPVAQKYLDAPEQQLLPAEFTQDEILSHGQPDRKIGSQMSPFQGMHPSIETAIVKYLAERSPGKSPRSTSGSSPILWLQKCASRLFKHSAKAEHSIQRKESESPTSSIPEEEVERQGTGHIISKSGQAQVLAECSKQINEDADGTFLKSFNQNFSFGHEGQKIKSNSKSLKQFKRKKSIRAVVEEAKEFIDESLDESDNDRRDVKESGEDAQAHLLDKYDTQLTGKRLSFERAADEREESGSWGKRRVNPGKKRRRSDRSSLSGTNECDINAAEAEQRCSPGIHKKKRQQHSTNSPTSEDNKDKGRRYNFRDTTIAAMNSPKKGFKEYRCQNGEKQDPETQLASTHDEVVLERFCYGKREVLLGVEHEGEELQERNSQMHAGIDDEGHMSQQELLLSEEEVYTDSRIEENGENDGETCEGTKLEDENEQESQSLKEKLWTFLTT